MLRPVRTILVLLLLAGRAIGAWAADPTPYLQVETGMHQATINRVAVLRGGSAIATVSDDKTARIWSTGMLEPLGVIRPPIGPGDDGALDAVAATGNILAVGGRIRYGDLFGVQFYRLSDLKLIGHRSELPAPVSAISFSRGGETLCVGMVGGRGLLFLDMRNGSQVGADTSYQGQVQWIDTAADGRTVTSGEDGRLRLYGAAHTKIADVALPHADRPYAVAFAPNGRAVAAGVQGSAVVWLLDPNTLRPLSSLTGAAGRVGGFGIVAYTPDGGGLIAAGTYKSGSNTRRLVRRWALDTGRATEFEAGGDTITDVVPVGDSIIVSDAEPVLSRFDESARPIVSRAANHIDFRDAGVAGFATSYDGGAIELPVAGASGGALFDVRLRSLSPMSAASTLMRPRDKAGGLEATQWRNSSAPRLNGSPVALEQDERSLAAAVAPDGAGAAFGTNFYLRFVRKDHTEWHVLVASPAWAVNISANGSRVVAGLGDGTVRWFDAANGNALLTLFLDPINRHWVLSTPEGFFDHDAAAPGHADGRGLIGYRFNDPPAEVSRFVETGQLYPIYYRPDLVGLALSSNPAAGAAIRQAHFRSGAIETVLTRGLPAHLEMQEVCGITIAPPDWRCPSGQTAAPSGPGNYRGARFFTGEAAVLLRFRLNSQTGLPGSALIYRNGARVSPTLATVTEDLHSRVQAALIPLGEGVNSIKVLPVSANGEIEGSDGTELTFDVVRRTTTEVSGAANAPHRNLFVLSIGVTRYSLAAMDLPNARNDAQAVADLMKAPDPPVYDVPVVSQLFDDQATLAGITSEIKTIADKAGPDDLVLLFFAGHGADVDGRYYFAPADFATHNPALTKTWLADGPASGEALDQIFRKEGLGHDQLISLLQEIKSTRVAIILDTCYSASIAVQDAVLQQDMNKTMANALGHAAGRMVLSSATAEAQDSAAGSAGGAHNGNGHGLFTGYLLDALTGQAAGPQDDTIDVDELAKFTKRMVRTVTAAQGQPQEPWFFFAGNDFFAVRSTRSALRPRLAPPPPVMSDSQTHNRMQ